MAKISEWLQSRLLFIILNTLRKTYRYYHLGEENRSFCQKIHPQGGYLLACWHQQFVMISLGQVGHPFRPLASRSRFGRIIAYVFGKMGFRAVHGSQKRDGKDKGGQQARDTIIKLTQEGYPSAFTVDGSIGPAKIVKPGIIDIARKTGAGILPVSAYADRYWSLKTWDQTQIPKPFAKIYLAYGSPMTVESTTENYEQLQEELRLALIAGEHRSCGALQQGSCDSTSCDLGSRHE